MGLSRHLRIFRALHFSSSPFSNSCPRSYSTSSKPVVGILGGGITGLSVAYYVNKLYGDKVQTVLFEEKDRCGGWIKTVKGKDGGFFEMGPRTIRPFGIRGLNTLDLVEEIGMDTQVLYVQKNHDVAKDRWIYVNGGLVKLPADYSVLYKKVEPFSRPLVWAVLKDIFARRKTLPDDSIYNFVSRRFGTEVAEYLTDPMIRGILAGDSKNISVKFLMKGLFELEQKYGSVVIGTVRDRFAKSECTLTDDDNGIGFSRIAAASLTQNWAVWGMEGGVEGLTSRMFEVIRDRGVQVKSGCRVEGLDFEGEGVRVRYSLGGRGDTVECDHVVSCVGSGALAGILDRSTGVEFRGVVEELKAVEYASLRVTGVRYEGDQLDVRGFGFLVPGREKSVGGLLGVVFDTNCFPQGGDTVVTVMSRGDESLGDLKGLVRKTLGIRAEAKEVVSEEMVRCIPQYSVGHYERVKRVLEGVRGKIGVCGAWVDGVSVNDCVYQARSIALNLGKKIDGESERIDNVNKNRAVG